MKFKKITLSSVISLFVVSVGCSPSINFVENSKNFVTTQSFHSFGFDSQGGDDTEFGGETKNISFSLNRLIKENLSQDKERILFKMVNLKKGKSTSIAEKNGSFKVSGVVQYHDDKGNLKNGAYITAKILVDGREVAKTETDLNGRWNSLVEDRFRDRAMQVIFTFSNKYWNIRGKDAVYEWEGPLVEKLTGDIDTGIFAPVKDSENAKTAWIHDIYLRYLKFFAKEDVAIDGWWQQQIKTIWPMNSNYYTRGTVNLSDAKQWDVNGHEIGHALTDIGTNSQMGGGFHKIDECYTTNLAWSEGFATFLAGAVSLENNDPDARFEFLVPRRAPIRMENVPADVCNGQKNEWRVSAALWDLYDLNSDGQESVSVPFKTIWTAVSRKERRIGSMQDAANSLKEIVSGSLLPGIDQANQFNTMF